MSTFSKAILVFSISTIAHAQEFGQVNLNILMAQLPNSEKSIDVTYHKQKMYYVNANNKEKLFSEGFDVAYPFFLKSALVQNNGKYGVIDVKGNFFVSPTYRTVELAPFEHESHIVLFDDGKIFNLQTGKETNSYLRDEESAVPKWNIFRSKNGKYGINKKDKVIIPANYDNILEIVADLIIVVQKGKIGLIDFKENIRADFNYEDANYSISQYSNTAFPTIGLKKDTKWIYFKHGEEILKSKYQCFNFATLLPNSIGIFSKKGKLNILFKDGNILENNYDFISENGLVGVRKNKIYLLKNDRSRQLYYSK